MESPGNSLHESAAASPAKENLLALCEQFGSKLSYATRQQLATYYSHVFEAYRVCKAGRTITTFVPKTKEEQQAVDALPLFLSHWIGALHYQPGVASSSLRQAQLQGTPKKALEDLLLDSVRPNLQEMQKVLLYSVIKKYQESYVMQPLERFVHDLASTALLYLAKHQESPLLTALQSELEQHFFSSQHPKQDSPSVEHFLVSVPHHLAGCQPSILRQLAYEAQKIYDFFDPEHYIKSPSITLAEVVGYETEKKQIFSIFDALKYPAHYEAWGAKALGLSFKLLLTGEPGTGKTYLSQAIANHYQLDYFEVPMQQLFDKYVGNSEKIIKYVLSYVLLRNHQALVFLDDAESIGMPKASEDRVGTRILGTLLPLLDGKKEYESLPIIAATSKPDLLGADFLRRFLRIHLSLPDEEQRKALFVFYTQKVPSLYRGNLDFAVLAKASNGKSAYAIKEAVKHAVCSLAYASLHQLPTHLSSGSSHLLTTDVLLEYLNPGY
ncbi:MAG: ATP-binding protein [Candidatus Woesearchaeota archaeon]